MTASSHKERQQKQVVGAYISRQLANELSQRALVAGLPRSRVIERAIVEYMLNNRIDEQELLNRLASRLQAEWGLEKLRDQYKNGWDGNDAFSRFRKHATQELARKGLTDQQIGQIKERLCR